MYKDKQFEQLMRLYKVPVGSNNLADKIILATEHLQQKRSIWKWISRIFEEFKLPSPIYSLTIVLVMGFFVGFLTSNNDNSNDTAYAASDRIVEQFIYGNENEEIL